MKIELQCPSCRKAYVVDSSRIPASGGVVRCHECDAAIPLQAPAPTTSTREKRPASKSKRPRNESAPPRPAAAATDDVVCPRCGLHFSPTGDRAEPRKDRPTVLIVEDINFFREIAKDVLREKYAVECAGSIAEALEILGRIRVDLILLDLNLENGESGLTLLNTMPGPRIPVLAFTAQDEAEMYGDAWRRLQDLGVRDVVRKGMNLGETLLVKVDALMAQSGFDVGART